MIFARVAAAVLAAGVFCLALPLAASADAVGDEAATATYLESILHAPDRLEAFFAALPKGADLHNHASGAVYAEDYLAWAQRDGGCYDPKTYALASTCAAGARRIADGVSAEPNFGKNVVDALSMANFVPTTPTAGHDHFFGTFGLFGDVAYTHRAGVVAAATSDAARQHVDVLELMVSLGSDQIGALAKRFGTGGNPAFSESDFAADGAVIERGGGFAAAVVAGKKDVADLDAGRRALLRCGTPAADPGCAVDVHYLLQVTRVADAPHVFVQTRVALAVASDPRSRAVGINYVAPEDNPRAVADYALHMRIVRDLHARYPSARVSLHAGELTPVLVQPDALRDHVRTAVEVAGASRIGHGVDVLGEDNAQQLLGEMASRRTLVEIALTSNDVILNVRGAAHPLPVYLEHGVPVALVTDDPGVARSNLSREFLRAETTYAFPYLTLKRMVRNSVEYAFLAGGSLWADPSYAHRVVACESTPPGGGTPAAGACAAYLDANPRALAQYKLEGELRAFESATARGTGRAAN
jgi:adenosine deaminase